MLTAIKIKALFFIVFLCIMPLNGYAGIVENIKSSCPTDPTQNGRCALEEVIEDGPSCRNIGGEEVCEDWWKKDYRYKCTGSFDPDTILTKVGTEFCEQTRQCTQWTDLEKNGGVTSCRVYVDVNRPGCDVEPVASYCIADDCGDLFDRCTMKQYVNYGTIQDRANLADDINCDPASGSCSAEILAGSLSGNKLGVYTFECPAEIKKICTAYADTLTCPDGTTQLCNKSKVCKTPSLTTSTVRAQKSCSADRQFETYSVLKNITGTSDSTPEELAKDADSSCIKIGEIGTCDTTGCANIDSYGVRYFVRGGGTMATLDGMNAWDWGYAKVWGLGEENIRVYGFATGLDGQCGAMDVTISTGTAPGTLLGYVHPNWEGGCQSIAVKYDGYTCSDGSCIHAIRFEGMGAPTVYVPVMRIESQYNCFSNSLQMNCAFPPELSCTQLSDTTNIDSLECLMYELDTNMLDTKCKKYLIQYECSEVTTTQGCAEYEEILQCGNVVYPINDVKAQGEDHTNDFGAAMALAQATNELKHVWTGKSKVCESGTWWLFDSQSLGDYVKSKLMSYALSYLGGAIFSKVASTVAESHGCVTNAVLSGVKYGTGNGGAASFVSGQTTSVGDCFSNAAFKGLTTVGLSPEQASKFMNFMGDPVTMAAINIAYDIISSVDNCSTCSEEQCAKDHSQYDPYAMISNNLCHFIGNDCTWKISIGVADKCMRSGYNYCCYDSIFARILVEQAYAQKEYSWGSYDQPNCTQLTFEDLKTLDFDAMDFSEFVSSLEAKTKGNVDEAGYKQKILDSITLPD